MDYEELYDEQQLIYKRTPMDFIDHLWELLSRNLKICFLFTIYYLHNFFLIQQRTAAVSANYPKVYSTRCNEPNRITQWYDEYPIDLSIVIILFRVILGRCFSTIRPDLVKCCARTMRFRSLQGWSPCLSSLKWGSKN